jgi:hypothetical protein
MSPTAEEMVGPTGDPVILRGRARQVAGPENPVDRWMPLLGDAGEGLPIAPLGEPAQQELRVCGRVLRRRGDGRCRHAGLGRPLEGGQALQWLPIREADNLIVSLEDGRVLGGVERHRCGQRSRQRSGRRFRN